MCVGRVLDGLLHGGARRSCEFLDDLFCAVGLLCFGGGDGSCWCGVRGGGISDAVGGIGVSGLWLTDGHGECGESLVAYGSADVAVVDWEGCDVFFGDFVLVEFPGELSGVCGGCLEDCEAAGVGEDGVLHGRGEVFEFGEALSGEDERCAEFAEFGEHCFVVDALDGLHFVDGDEGSGALVRVGGFLVL